jgi:hypothetical protein
MILETEKIGGSSQWRRRLSGVLKLAAVWTSAQLTAFGMLRLIHAITTSLTMQKEDDEICAHPLQSRTKLQLKLKLSNCDSLF